MRGRRWRTAALGIGLPTLLVAGPFVAVRIIATGPPAPVVTATPRDSGVDLTWPAVQGTGTVTYDVERGPSPAGPWTDLGSGVTVTGGMVEYDDVGRLNRLPLVYRVASVDSSGTGAPSAPVTATPEPAAYEWDFDRPDLDTEGWTYITDGRVRSPGAVSEGKFQEKVSNATYQGAVSPDYLDIDAAQYPGIEIRLDNPRRATRAIVYWDSAAGRTFTGADSAEVPLVTADTGYHVYDVPLTGAPGWAGTISSLRVDLFNLGGLGGTVGSTGTFVNGLDYVKLIRSPGAGSTTPLVGAIRWDAWVPNNTATPTSACASSATYVDGSVYTDYDYRQPEHGWFDGPSTDTGICPNPAALPVAQQDMDQDIVAAAAGGLDYWAFDWYGPGLVASDFPEGESALLSYLASPDKDLLQFALVIGGLYTTTAQTSALVAELADPQYVRVADPICPPAEPRCRPLVYYFSSSAPGSAGLSYLGSEQVIDSSAAAAGLFRPLFVNACQVTTGVEATTHYGPCGITTGARHQSFAALVQADRQAVGAQGGGTVVPGVTLNLDHRPRNVGGAYSAACTAARTCGPARWWFDEPTVTEWQNDVQSFYDGLIQYPGRTTGTPTMLIYSWNEIDEGGAGLEPSDQFATSYLDALHEVVTGEYASRYWQFVDDDNCSVRYDGVAACGNRAPGGGWRYIGPSTPTLNVDTRGYLHTAEAQDGFFDNDEHQTSTPGDVLTYVPETTGGAWATRVQVIGETGPDRGTLAVSVNGGAASTFGLTGSGARPGQVLADVSAPGGAPIRTVSVSDVSGRIGIDALRLEYTRDSGTPLSGPEPPQRLTASPGAGAIGLSWDKSASPGVSIDDASYAVYRATTPSFGDGVEIGTVAAPADSDTSLRLGFLDTSTAPGRVYFYRVTGISSGGSEGDPSAVTSGVAGTDLANGQSYSASSDAATAGLAFDGRPDTAWRPATGAAGEYVQATFAGPTTFNRVTVDEIGTGLRGFQVQYLSGGTWHTAYTGTGVGVYDATADGGYRSITFGAVTGGAVRLLLDPAGGTGPVPSVAEVQVFLN